MILIQATGNPLPQQQQQQLPAAPAVPPPPRPVEAPAQSASSAVRPTPPERYYLRAPHDENEYSFKRNAANHYNVNVVPVLSTMCVALTDELGGQVSSGR